MKKTKIAYLISTLETGGAERQLINTINSLNFDKYEVVVFVLKNRLKLREQLDSNINVIVLDIKSYYNIFELRLALKKIYFFKPDILHSVMYASNLLARLYKFFYKNCFIINHIHGLGTWIKWYHISIDRFLLKFVDKIIVVSRKSYQLRRVREKYPIEKLELVYNSIDSEKFLKAFNSIELKNDFIILGTASRLVELKQIDKVIDLIKILVSRGLPIKYFIAGDGPQLSNLKKKVIDLDLSNQVIFFGNVEDMPSFYQKIHLFFLNSKTEDMPLSIVEAFASGLAVLAPNIGAIEELLNGNDGLIFDPKLSVDSLANLVESYIQSNQIKKRSYGNKSFAVENFDNKIHQIAIDKIYSQINNRNENGLK